MLTMPLFLQQVGLPELLLILLIILLIFGPGKIPQLARSLGEAIREFRKAMQGVSEEVEKPAKKTSEKIDEETLAKLAEKLGVETKGKSKEELMEEVLAKAKEKGLLE